MELNFPTKNAYQETTSKTIWEYGFIFDDPLKEIKGVLIITINVNEQNLESFNIHMEIDKGEYRKGVILIIRGILPI